MGHDFSIASQPCDDRRRVVVEPPSMFGPTGRFRFEEINGYQTLVVELRNGAPGRFRWETATRDDADKVVVHVRTALKDRFDAICERGENRMAIRWLTYIVGALVLADIAYAVWRMHH